MVLAQEAAAARQQRQLLLASLLMGLWLQQVPPGGAV
jgi:hypothetical protein